MRVTRAAFSGMLMVVAGAVGAQDRPRQAEASNMQLVGYHDLQGRSAFQPVIVQQNGHWIAYVGHHGGQSVNSLHRAERSERHLDSRRYRSAPAQTSASHSNGVERSHDKRRGQRGADGAGLRRQTIAERRPREVLYAARRGIGSARSLGRERAGKTRAHHSGCRQFKLNAC